MGVVAHFHLAEALKRDHVPALKTLSAGGRYGLSAQAADGFALSRPRI